VRLMARETFTFGAWLVNAALGGLFHHFGMAAYTKLPCLRFEKIRLFGKMSLMTGETLSARNHGVWKLHRIAQFDL